MVRERWCGRERERERERKGVRAYPFSFALLGLYLDSQRIQRHGRDAQQVHARIHSPPLQQQLIYIYIYLYIYIYSEREGGREGERERFPVFIHHLQSSNCVYACMWVCVCICVCGFVIYLLRYQRVRACINSAPSQQQLCVFASTCAACKITNSQSEQYNT
jgi:hypothetical protein